VSFAVLGASFQWKGVLILCMGSLSTFPVVKGAVSACKSGVLDGPTHIFAYDRFLIPLSRNFDVAVLVGGYAADNLAGCLSASSLGYCFLWGLEPTYRLLVWTACASRTASTGRDHGGLDAVFLAQGKFLDNCIDSQRKDVRAQLIGTLGRHAHQGPIGASKLGKLTCSCRCSARRFRKLELNPFRVEKKKIVPDAAGLNTANDSLRCTECLAVCATGSFPRGRGMLLVKVIAGFACLGALHVLAQAASQVLVENPRKVASLEAINGGSHSCYDWRDRPSIR